MNKNRRRHSKIVTDLPEDIRAQVDKRIATPGTTYQSIHDFLHEQGYSVSLSSIGRYGKDFLSRLEKLKIFRDQARTILEEGRDRPVTEISEATSQVAMQLIMEHLMSLKDLQGASITELLKAFSNIEKSAVARERIKMEFNSRAQKTVDKVKDRLKGKNVPAETIHMIEEDILGIVRK